MSYEEAVNSAPESRGMVEVFENLPEDLLPAEDFNEDGEVLFSGGRW